MFLQSQHCKLRVALTLEMSLAACTSMIEQAEMADVTDEAFGRQLHAEYLELARAEKAEYDNSDADASTAAASTAAASTAAAAPAPATMRAASYSLFPFRQRSVVGQGQGHRQQSRQGSQRDDGR